ncbi:hypothetical protein [Sphingobium sp. Leaf26]|uniref:hypothetical protein n=1 Tax=Sphingobium sp. Leaf26 TaxID=1735693 RepID=UPI00138F0291|nr:hypothetical protein [Sphingobium sp. Leaf26]
MVHMKLFGIFPNLSGSNVEADAPNSDQAKIEAVADLIVAHMSSDPALFAMEHAGEFSGSPIELDQTYGHVRASHITDPKALREMLLDFGNPNSGKWLLVRSLVTCRSIMYGWDGQAFVCLPNSAPAISSPDADFITVQDLSNLILETDYMDGLFSDEELDGWAEGASLMRGKEGIAKFH